MLRKGVQKKALKEIMGKLDKFIKKNPPTDISKESHTLSDTLPNFPGQVALDVVLRYLSREELVGTWMYLSKKVRHALTYGPRPRIAKSEWKLHAPGRKNRFPEWLGRPETVANTLRLKKPRPARQLV